MPGLIPKLTLAHKTEGIHVTCSLCPLEALAPTRPAADTWAINHEKAHLLGLARPEDQVH